MVPESSQSFGASVIVSFVIISFIADASTYTLSCKMKNIENDVNNTSYIEGMNEGFGNKCSEIISMCV